MAKLWNPFRPVPITVLVEEHIHQTRLDLLNAQEDAECATSRVNRLKTTLNRLVEEREQLHALEEAGLAYAAGLQAVPLKTE
jgi:uncharacterized protein (DUF3084 family)